MKVAVSTVQPQLDALVDPRFGRAAYYIIIDPDSMKYESIPNPNINSLGGAGIQSAQFVINKGVKSVLTGKCGPKAFAVFESAGIKIYEDIDGTAREAIKAFRNDQITFSKIPGGKPDRSKKRK